MWEYWVEVSRERAAEADIYSSTYIEYTYVGDLLRRRNPTMGRLMLPVRSAYQRPNAARTGRERIRRHFKFQAKK